MNLFTLSIVLILFSCFFQGTFGLGMKKYAPLSWEAFWLMFSIFGMIVIPFIWAYEAVPNLLSLVAKVPSANLIMAILYGSFWGVGAIMYGLAINYLGLSLGNGITMGLAAAVGTLVPLFQISGYSSRPSFPFIIVGVIIMIVGISILTIAGIRRDRLQKILEGQSKDASPKKGIYLGLLMAVLCGILSAFANIGFDYAKVISNYAIADGVEPRNASLASWMVVFYGNFIINVLYSLFLLFKNKSINTVKRKGAYKGIIWAILTAFMWYAALAIYGQGAALMGEIGTVIGWTMFLSFALVISNVWGISFGEWKGVRKPLQILLIGNFILLISFVILGYANTL